MTQNALPKRTELPDEAKWRLEDIYPADDGWEGDFRKVKELLPQAQDLRGRLVTSADNLLQGLSLSDEIGELVERLYAYARMRRDEDNSVTQYQAMTDRAATLLAEAGAATSFITPEILAAEPGAIEAMLAQSPDLALYRHLLEDTLRHRPHTLSSELEQLLAKTQEMAQGPETIFSMFSHADLKFPNIRDEAGNEVPLSEGRLIRFLESPDRRVRREAFQGLLQTYGKYANTLAAVHAASVKKDVFYARVRNFPSALAASLHAANIPVSVYTNLIDTVHRHLPLLHRYLEVRKRRLGLDELRMYDLYTPIVQEADRKVPYAEAAETVAASLAPLGDEYLTSLRRGLAGHWVDVYENEGKTSGAYSWGAYGSHPFVLLNYQDTVNDMFTLAHEFGHAMHSFFSQAAQPYVYHSYPTFLAEVASTFNENLLMHHLLGRTKDPKERLFLVNHHLEGFRTVVFRQTMFAEFEMLTHQKAEAGEALTPELLKGMYRELNLKYYGAVVNVDDEIAMEWARIPHFYRAFYVYQYATGYSAATALSQKVLSEGQPAVDRYLEFLQAGGSDYPIDILQRAGVDMTTPQPVEAALGVFGKLVEEMEQA